jgi:hypothetical protein
MRTDTQALTQLEFTSDDHDVSDRIARHLGYTQTAYTSTSALWGLFCLRDSAQDRKPEACIIKTRELGFLVVSDLEDLGLDARGRRERGTR